MNSISFEEFFDHFSLDPIVWAVPHKPDDGKGYYYDPNQGDVGFLESRRIRSDKWQIEFRELPDPQYKTIRYNFITPKHNEF